MTAPRPPALPRGATLRVIALAAFVALTSMSAVAPSTASATSFSTGQNASLVLGAPDFTTPTSGPRMDRSFVYPQGAELDPSGRLLVADHVGGRVAVYPTVPTINGAAMSFAIGGTPNEYYQDCTATRNDSPTDVSSSGTRLAIADRYAPRVLLYDTFPTGNGAAASIALGQPNLTTCPYKGGLRPARVR